MNTMIALGQQENLVNVIAAAARKSGEEAVDELAGNGVLTEANFQRVLAQGDKIGAVVKAAVKIALAELANNVVGRLKRLFAECTIELAENDGKATISGAKDVFAAGIYGAAKRSACKTTPKVLLAVYEMIKDGTFQQIFGGFGENLKRLCWTEAQIVAFCRDSRNREYLRAGGYGTFFLFEGEGGGFFVAYVSVRGGGRLGVFVFSLGGGGVWCADYQRRVVVPQL